eukprot:1821026-Rhodomonas_salina.1
MLVFVRSSPAAPTLFGDYYSYCYVRDCVLLLLSQSGGRELSGDCVLLSHGPQSQSRYEDTGSCYRRSKNNLLTVWHATTTTNHCSRRRWMSTVQGGTPSPAA